MGDLKCRWHCTWVRVEYGAWCKLAQVERDCPVAMLPYIHRHAEKVRAYLRRRQRRVRQS